MSVRKSTADRGRPQREPPGLGPDVHAERQGDLAVRVEQGHRGVCGQARRQIQRVVQRAPTAEQATAAAATKEECKLQRTQQLLEWKWPAAAAAQQQRRGRFQEAHPQEKQQQWTTYGEHLRCQQLQDQH